MAKRWNRTETWLGLAVLGIATLLAGIFGLFMYMSATAVPLHPDPQRAPSETRSTPAAEWRDAVARGRQVMRDGLTAQNVPGLSVAVGLDGEIIWAEGFGWADLERRVAVSPDHVFRIGTASMALTSAAAGLLVERGRLDLDEAIRTYVPEFPSSAGPVTVRQLMGHVSGVRNDGGDEGPLFTERCAQPADALPFFAERPLLFEPGTQFHPSSYGWILVSAAIEAAAGEPFLTFMREQVFEPLRMDDTRDDLAAPPADRVTAYFPRFAADPRYGPDVMRPIDYSCYAGASAFVSTPSDLVRFGMAIQRGMLLRPETVQRLQTSQRLRSGEETGYGLGWDLETVTLAGEAVHAAGHDGDSLGGTVASLLTFRDRNLVVAVTSNISYTDTLALASAVADAFAARMPDPDKP